METTIDRTSYRRKNLQYEEIKENKSGIKSLFFNEVIVAMAILIGILSIKLLNLEKAYEYIKQNTFTGIAFEDATKYALVEYEKIREKYLTKDLNETPKAEQVINIQLGEGANGLIEITEQNEEVIEPSIKNLSEDVEYIKQNYDLIMPLNGVITSKFGAREDPNPIVSDNHLGLDIAANMGTVIVSSHDGTIIEAGTIGTYGKCIMIQKDNLITVYAHCSAIKVKKGDVVKQGEKIGEVGMTGNATGPHVHFEVRIDGKYIDPEEVI